MDNMESSFNDMELEIWQGDMGLPSIDPHCLAVMAYCKFSSVHVEIKPTNAVWKSTSGELPVLKHGKEATLSKVNDIFNYLRKNNMGTDFDLTGKQSADIVAFTALVEEKLLPALLHLYWVDPPTYAEFTWPWFVKNLPFPHNYYVPLQRHKECVNRLRLTRDVDNTSESVAEQEAKIYREAKECLNLLSSKLGDNSYFFGTTPSSLDAVIFGYLAPLLKATLPNTQLQNHLRGCENLCQLCTRILDRYFPRKPEEIEAEREKKEEEERNKREDRSQFPNKRRNMLVSGMVAMTAMVGYAFMSGLVQIEVTDDDNSNGQRIDSKSADFSPLDQAFEEQSQQEGNTSG